MYKVFVVDDEIVIREGLRNNFRWEENGFSLVGEASDGEIALPMIRDERPDILITDIRMPFMDGIALCREVHKVMPWIQIVILSGYDSFEYAKQAISLGVQEYLLKPISSRDLGEVLLRIKDRIERENAERRDLEKLRSQMTAGRQMVLSQVLGNVLMNKLPDEEGEKICTQMRAMGVNLFSPCYTVIEFRKGGGACTYPDLHAAMMQSAENWRETVFLYSNEKALCALVLGDSEQDIEERAYSFARSALDELERSDDSGAWAAIGEMVRHFGDVSRSYQSARHIRRSFESSGQPLQMRRIIGSRDSLPPARQSGQAIGVQSLYEHMKYVDLGDFQEHYAGYLRSLRDMGALLPIDGKYLYTEALVTAFRIIQEAGGDPKELLDARWLEREEFSQEDFERAASEGLTVLHRAIKYRDSKGQVKGNPAVNKARQYLAGHFTDPGLTFQEVVDHVAMSTSHFSTLFAQSTGSTFTKYLINLRMTKARELLYNTDMRSSEIAYAVGFSDPHYFSYLFKKQMGVTPSEFRAAVGKANVSGPEDE